MKVNVISFCLATTLFLTPSLSAAPSFASAPREWAVAGGAYAYTPETAESGVIFTVSAQPVWLVWDGTSLRGSVPEEREGFIEKVTIRATDGSGSSDQTFEIRVGRLVGPVASPPGGGSKRWVTEWGPGTGMPQVARSGYNDLLISDVSRANSSRADWIPIFWGLKTQGFGMKMNYVGPSGADGQDFTVPSGFTFSPGEVGVLNPSISNPEAGLGYWQAQTNQPASIGGAPVATYLRAELRDEGDTVSLPWVRATQYGLDDTVGVLAEVPDSGALRVKLQLNATAPGGTPALDWFNDLKMKNQTDRTITELSNGFYWVDTVPTVSGSLAAQVSQQGGVVVFTTGMLGAADAEDDQGLRFVLGDGADGLPPRNGVIQTLLSDDTWADLAAGDSFTLQQLEAGEVRYQHDGGYDSADSFDFQVADAQGALARDGDTNWFAFGITIDSAPPPVDPGVSLSRVIRYQGRITGTGANAASGYFVFALFSGDEVLWNSWQGIVSPAHPGALDLGSEQCMEVTLERGAFAVGLGAGPEAPLGKNPPIPPSVLLRGNHARKLAVWFSSSPDGNYTRLNPDVELAAEPYAMVAGVAEKVLPGALNASMLAPDAALGAMPVDTGLFSTHPDDADLRDRGFVRLADPVQLNGGSFGEPLYFYRKVE